jgi:hypothetical protein
LPAEPIMSSINNIPIWKENENRIARQAAMRSFMEANNAMADTLTSAGSTESDGLSEIVAKVALKRISAQAAAKSAKEAAAKADTDAREKELAKVKDRMADYVKMGTAPIVDVTV